MRGWTDSGAALSASADYDAFGSVASSTGTLGQFRFTGEQWDATGFEYLRARYYDPVLGRLTAADTVQPNAEGTQGWNLYAYVANNPTTWIDPTGHVAAGAIPRPPTAGGVTDSLAPYMVGAARTGRPHRTRAAASRCVHLPGSLVRRRLDPGRHLADREGLRPE
ncbi:MAG: RHS repeat-associated core domain-containing protein [Dehalococcoidia bacterium]|nr:RHS repeat-associated core domain-containing protein [Dehalococcoidia bacterium]